MDFVDFSKRKNQFNLSDRVVWVNEANEPKRGTVRWVGLAKNKHMIGVEFETSNIPYDPEFPRLEIERRFFSRPGTGRIISPDHLLHLKEFAKDAKKSKKDQKGGSREFQILLAKAEEKIKEIDEELNPPKPELPPRNPTSKYKDLDDVTKSPSIKEEPIFQSVKAEVSNIDKFSTLPIRPKKKPEMSPEPPRKGIPTPKIPVHKVPTPDKGQILSGPTPDKGQILSGLLANLADAKKVAKDIKPSNEMSPTELPKLTKSFKSTPNLNQALEKTPSSPKVEERVPPLPPKNKNRIYEKNTDWIRMGKVVSWKKDKSMKRIYGYIRWFGDLNGVKTIGIEFDKPVDNGNSGEGLFKCEEGCGVLVALRKVLHDPTFELYLPTKGSYAPSNNCEPSTPTTPIPPKQIEEEIKPPKPKINGNLTIKINQEIQPAEVIPNDGELPSPSGGDLVREFTGLSFIGQREIDQPRVPPKSVPTSVPSSPLPSFDHHHKKLLSQLSDPGIKKRELERSNPQHLREVKENSPPPIPKKPQLQKQTHQDDNNNYVKHHPGPNHIPPPSESIDNVNGSPSPSNLERIQSFLFEKGDTDAKDAKIETVPQEEQELEVKGITKVEEPEMAREKTRQIPLKFAQVQEVDLVELEAEMGEEVIPGDLPLTPPPDGGVADQTLKKEIEEDWDNVSSKEVHPPNYEKINLIMDNRPRNNQSQIEVDTSCASSGSMQGSSEMQNFILPPILPPISLAYYNWNDDYRGIRGYNNSCYIDAIVFSMFAFTNHFDFLLLQGQESPRQDLAIQEQNRMASIALALRMVVNKLREKFDCPSAVMRNLRGLLTFYDSKIDSAFMDVEEVFYIFFQKAFHQDYFLHLESGIGDFVFQIVLPSILPSNSMILPTTQSLTELCFLDLRTKFTKLPSPCLILQLPRENGVLKDMIVVPSLTLDLTNLLSYSKKYCAICGDEATIECLLCFRFLTDMGLESTLFCTSCENAVHKHPERKHHRRKMTKLTCSDPGGAQINPKMNLLAVLCIRGHHYVSFVKCSTDLDSPWVFFDSDPGGRKSKAQILRNFGGFLNNIQPENIHGWIEKWSLLDPLIQRILTDSYVFIYIPSPSAEFKPDPKQTAI